MQHEHFNTLKHASVIVAMQHGGFDIDNGD